MTQERIKDADMYDDPSILGDAVGMVGVVLVNKEPRSLSDDELTISGKAHFNGAKAVKAHVEDFGKDVMARMTDHGLVLIIGFGIAVTAAAVGAVVIHEHQKK